MFQYDSYTFLFDTDSVHKIRCQRLRMTVQSTLSILSRRDCRLRLQNCTAVKVGNIWGVGKEAKGIGCIFTH